jgi:hypothetical protein
MEMYNETGPILTEVRTWFKDKSLEDMGRKYWKKRSYVFQGFVRENPIGDDKTPENPIRRFIIGPQIFATIKSALMDPELEELPTDFNAGLDFRITKTTKGGYADYSTSKWARKESGLTDIERAAIEQHGLHNLSDFLPKKPGYVELKVMKEMFEASVEGQPFDMDRWGQYFKPAGYGGGVSATVSTTGTPAKAPAPTPAPVASAPADDAPFDTDNAPSPTAPVSTTKATQKTEDILAMIRARQNKS